MFPIRKKNKSTRSFTQDEERQKRTGELVLELLSQEKKPTFFGPRILEIFTKFTNPWQFLHFDLPKVPHHNRFQHEKQLLDLEIGWNLLGFGFFIALLFVHNVTLLSFSRLHLVLDLFIQLN